MVEKTIAVKLNPRLEKEGRGLCDPQDPRNSEVITLLNYGAKGYLRVYPSGFIQAQIQAGVLLRVPESQASGSTKGTASANKAQSGRKSPAHKP
ncbi:MAG: hypothetical protein ACETWG_10595 [Candidatus Neomarinimicrobiota bacterium]